MSETAASRSTLTPYLLPPVIDIGFGGDPICIDAITFDMVNPYTKVGKVSQTLQGDCRKMPFICDGAFNTVYSSHLVEDFTYAELQVILTEWRRILRSNGRLIINAPNQARFVEHCQRTGQRGNSAHKEQDFCLDTFLAVLQKTGAWKTIYSCESFGAYCWLHVSEKLP